MLKINKVICVILVEYCKSLTYILRNHEIPSKFFIIHNIYLSYSIRKTLLRNPLYMDQTSFSGLNVLQETYEICIEGRNIELCYTTLLILTSTQARSHYNETIQHNETYQWHNPHLTVLALLFTHRVVILNRIIRYSIITTLLSIEEFPSQHKYPMTRFIS